MSVCLKRNEQRNGNEKVKNNIINEMYNNFEPPIEKDEYLTMIIEDSTKINIKQVNYLISESLKKSDDHF